MAATTKLVAATLVVLAAGCSSGSDDGADTTVPVTTASAPQVASAASASVPASANSGATATVPTGPPVSTQAAPATTIAVAETGVPGLASDDSFCAAWSRFGGSWQVLVQAGASNDAAEVARLEVVASTLVDAAYDDVFAAWPAELEAERDVVADDYFGAFRRRSADAAQALTEAGASDADRERLAEAWTAALEQYDPAAAVIAVAVPADLEPLVGAAAATFAARRVALPADPSMVISAETPSTDAFLATACPDAGWIVGQEVTEG